MKYKVTTTIGVTAYTIVEANNPDQAKDIAAERPLMDAPHNLDSMGDVNEQFIVAELDGEVDPDDLTAEEYDQ